MARGKPTAAPKVTHKVVPNIDFSKIDFSYERVRAAIKKMTDEKVVSEFKEIQAMPYTDRTREDRKILYWAHERLKREGKLNLLTK
jgi:hypothetical protein